MQSCSACKKLRIVHGCYDDYRQLAHYHYRDSRPGPCKAIFALKPDPESTRQSGTGTVGVIVYSAPIPEVQLRNVATDNFFAGFDKSTQLSLINKNIRCISRVIIEPRYRGLGLASLLVRRTMPEMNVPIIEAMAVMGLVNPFLEKAGMKPYTAKMSTRSAQLIEAFSMVTIEAKELVDPQEVLRKLARLPATKAGFIERQIRLFLQSYSRRRNMQPGPERTRYVLSKLTARPTYYIWFNENLSLSG
ncbi:MAG: hypothetical protein ACYTFW_01655 [Planctomycetota bacterium]|jgi:hypothetical protein